MKLLQFIIAFILIFVTGRLTAQVNGYQFATATNTALETEPPTGITEIFGAGVDDATINTVSLYNIGFEFFLGGNTYTRFSAEVNGFIRLGNTALTPSFDNTSSVNGFLSTVNMPVICPYFDDLHTVDNGSVKHWVTGNAPARKLVVQWHVAVPYKESGSANALFQLWLEEGTGKVSFVYGSGMLLNDVFGGYTIGIATAVNNFLSVTTVNNSVSSTFHNGIQTQAIASGRLYSFIPQVCSGIPTGGVTVAAASSVCKSGTVQLSVTGSSANAIFEYVWEHSADGTNYAEIPESKSASISLSQYEATWYRRKISCGNASAYSVPVFIDVEPLLLAPFNEGFESENFPPQCWKLSSTRNNNNDIAKAAVSANAIGNNSILFNFFNIPINNNLYLETPAFTTLTGNYRLVFDYAYAAYISPQADELEIRYSTDQGKTFTLLTTLTGGATGELNTYGGNGISSVAFIPGASQWKYKELQLPAGTNKIQFVGKSGFGNNLYIDNVQVEPVPVCEAPKTITGSNITLTRAVLQWIPVGGNTRFLYELRTSGSPGAGVNGLVNQGVANGSSLTLSNLQANTQYYFYLRAICGNDTSAYGRSPYIFRTLCGAVDVFPFTETFESNSNTIYCWNNSAYVNGLQPWTYGAGASKGGNIKTGAENSLRNAQFSGDGLNGNISRLISPQLKLGQLNATGAELLFWYANQGRVATVQNELRVYYQKATDSAWKLLPNAVFTHTVREWTEIVFNLPELTDNYRIAFEGTDKGGYDIVIDNVTIQATTPCRRLTIVEGKATTNTTIAVNAKGWGMRYLVEYGPVGFTPGTGANAGAGGTLLISNTDTLVITGLQTNTVYDIYLRNQCGDYLIGANKKLQIRTLCMPVGVPYTQNFNTATVPAMPACTSVQDFNGSSGSYEGADGGGAFETYGLADKSLLYLYDNVDITRPANDWFFTQGIFLTAGNTYRLRFLYKATDGVDFPEKLAAYYGTAATASSMQQRLFVNTNINTTISENYDTARVDFSPQISGVFYFGFHIFSVANSAGLFIDDISIKPAPLIDVGVVSVIAENTCPGSNTFKAVIKNFNLTPVNFANNPVTLSVNFSGTVNIPVNVTINNGILAPGDTLHVPFTANNFISGSYNYTARTVTAADTEDENDTFVSDVFVDRLPTAAIITPAAPVICKGDKVLLSTQFVHPEPATQKITVNSGDINLAILNTNASSPLSSEGDATISSLTIAGVPNTATVTGINVQMNIEHTFISDLIINLKAPNGKIFNLFNRNGGGSNNLINTVIGSAGTKLLPDADTPNVTAGPYYPAAAINIGPAGYWSDAALLAELGNEPNGKWELIVNDNFILQDNGVIKNWQLELVYGYPHPGVIWQPASGLYTDSLLQHAYFTPVQANTTTSFAALYASPETTTIYNVLTISSAGCTTTVPITVTVNPAPIIVFDSIPRICLQTPEVILGAQPAGGNWQGNGVTVNGRFNAINAGIGNHILTYRVNGSGGCSATLPVMVPVFADCYDVQLSDGAISIGPNPGNGIFKLFVHSALYTSLQLTVYNISGAVVHRESFSGLYPGTSRQLLLQKQAAGSYFVLITDPVTQASVVKKLIIAH